jgi:hypothetical protein
VAASCRPARSCRGCCYRQLCRSGYLLTWVYFKASVADPGSGAFLTPGPGSGIRNRFFPDPGSGISDPGSRISDPGSRIPTPYILELSDKCLGKKFYNSLKTGPNFFLQHLKNKIIFSFVKFVATKKV